MATTIATSAVANPLARAGARCIVQLGTGNLLVGYWDGTTGHMYASKEASSEANLATASALNLSAVGTGCQANDGVNFNLYADPAGNNAIAYGFVQGNFTIVDELYSAGAWGASGGQNGQGNGTDPVVPFSAVVSGTRYYWIAGAAGHIDVQTTFAVPNNGEKDTTFGTNPSYSDPCGFVALPHNGLVLRVAIDTVTFVLEYVVANALDGSGATYTSPAATTIETLTTSYTHNNLAAINDSNGNAWIAYNDGAGIKLRMMLAASSTVWSAKTTVTSQASDTCPALFQDTAGNIWVFWIDGGASNAIKGQKATVSGGAISLSGSVQTIISTSATRGYLTSIESNVSNAYLVWVEGTASPYNIVVHTYAISSSTVNGSATEQSNSVLADTANTLITSGQTVAGNSILSEISALILTPASEQSNSALSVTGGLAGNGGGSLISNSVLAETGARILASATEQSNATLASSAILIAATLAPVASNSALSVSGQVVTPAVVMMANAILLETAALVLAASGEQSNTTLTLTQALLLVSVAIQANSVLSATGHIPIAAGYRSPVGVTTVQPGLVGVTTAQSSVAATTATLAGMLTGVTAKE